MSLPACQVLTPQGIKAQARKEEHVVFGFAWVSPLFLSLPMLSWLPGNATFIKHGHLNLVSFGLIGILCTGEEAFLNTEV